MTRFGVTPSHAERLSTMIMLEVLFPDSVWNLSCGLPIAIALYPPLHV
jgi:hypothetical protein